MDFLVTFIIPVFNSELYISRCFESIINQTYANFEVIVINDGSTDNSPIICNEYSDRDERFKIIHIKNGGVSFARNIGIKNATGEFITFIDSDDYIKNDYIETLVYAACSNKVDLISCGCTIFDGNSSYETNSLAGYELNDRLIFSLVDSGMGGTAHCKLVRTNLIKQNNVVFNEKLSFREDLLFWCELSRYVHMYSNINYFGYYYYRSESNLSLSSKYDKTQFEKQFWVTYMIDNELNEQKIDIKQINVLLGKDVSRIMISTIKKQIRTKNFSLGTLKVMFDNNDFQKFKKYIQIQNIRDIIFKIPIKHSLVLMTYFIYKLRFRNC